MNTKLTNLILKLHKLTIKGKYFEAIEVNKEITKILNTYKECC